MADAFRSGLTLTERVKDGLAYKDAFDGREAVDLLCALLDTDNRNLALLLGRALDWQKFFHDVTYDHRLRDSAAELYQFRRRVIVPNAPFAAALAAGAAPDGGMSTPPSASAHGLVSDDGAGSIAASLASTALTTAPSSSGGERSSISSLPTTAGVHAASSLPTSPSSVLDQSLQLQQQQAAAAAGAADGGADDLPSGVFTLLSACYSPTCSSTSLCYSISCPLRIEQAKKLNMKPQPGLRKVASVESLKDDDDADGADGGPGLWANGVSQAVLDSVGDEERKRQEAINELIFTERDFVKDMEYLRDVRCPLLPSLLVLSAGLTPHPVHLRPLLVLGQAAAVQRRDPAARAARRVRDPGLLERVDDPRQQLVAGRRADQAPAVPARRRVGRRHLPRPRAAVPAVCRLRRPPGVRQARV